MCGVIGFICEKNRLDLGQVASDLLRTLEYRGYDSTGAAVQGEGPEVRLRKGVGAPSVMVHRLGIAGETGQILCGQVRWATFGAVDDLNSQPHVVRCKAFMYGAHNGNVTNCDELKAWLGSEGHSVVSDNDGEMVVHTIEHYFHVELQALPGAASGERQQRRHAMRTAIQRAAARLKGSYAAVVVDPVSRLVWGVKQGSSLYFGLGRDAPGGRFAIASSDLSAVLKLTRVLVPMSEGECVEYDATSYQLFCVRDRSSATPDGRRSFRAGELVPRDPVRSRLRAKDAALQAPFKTFMDQEIASQETTCRNVVTLFRGGTEASRVLAPFLEGRPAAELQDIRTRLEWLRDQQADEILEKSFHEIVETPAFRALLAGVSPELRRLVEITLPGIGVEAPDRQGPRRAHTALYVTDEQRRRPGCIGDEDGKIISTSLLRARGTSAPVDVLAEKLVSSEAGLFSDLLGMARDPDELLAVRLLDVLLEREETREFAAEVDRFLDMCVQALGAGGRIYLVCCGSSYHAAKAASLFFNELAHVQIHPVLPGEFRGEYSQSLRDGDLFIAVSQSGETKDLIDVMNDVIATGLSIGRAAIVNNVNSTLAQEKAQVVIPLRCGPEIAVPATKSFINQLTVLYCLALRLAEMRLHGGGFPEGERAARSREIERRREALSRLPALIRETFETTDAAVEQAAEHLFLCPSMHLLATRIIAVAMEGALKVREIVLNHAEGIEGSEFKHGPNTILGFNTVLGLPQVHALLESAGRVAAGLASDALRRSMSPEAVRALVQSFTEAVLTPRYTPFALDDEQRLLFDRALDRPALIGKLYQDYPLIFITGPDERDVALTVSQINTHKIRGAMTVVVAESHPALQEAASKAPTSNPSYRWVYIPLPRTNDNLMVVFSSTVALQRLALKMSVRKAQVLDQLGIQDHGVHPDVPKNVSKSITVD